MKSFYYLQCDSITSENSISLAHKFIDDRYSIVSQLYNQKLIDSRKFSFYIDTLFSGQLLFGDIPHNISNIFKYKITLPVDINEIKWKSNLKSVMYLNNEYDNKDEIYFDSAISNIMAPFSFFSEYNDKVMKDFSKLLTYLDNSYIPKVCNEIALNVVKNGAYYGYIVDSSDGIIL